MKFERDLRSFQQLYGILSNLTSFFATALDTPALLHHTSLPDTRVRVRALSYCYHGACTSHSRDWAHEDARGRCTGSLHISQQVRSASVSAVAAAAPLMSEHTSLYCQRLVVLIYISVQGWVPPCRCTCLADACALHVAIHMPIHACMTAA